MPKRKRVRRFASDEVQGKSSWVTIASMVVADQRKALKELAKIEASEATGTDLTIANFEAGVRMMKTHVREWNWVDDDGNPLSLPKDDPEVLEQLTDDEVAFLTKCIRGPEEDAKN